MKIIGVTGTNGKTTCVHMIVNLLKNNLNCASFGTLGINHYVNNKCLLTPTTLTTLGNKELHKSLKQVTDLGCKLVAMEVSSHGLVQDRVADINFTHVVFTNLSHDHLDYHQNFDNYFQAKSKLFIKYGKFAKRAIINLDCDYGVKLIKLLQQNMPNPELDIIGFSIKSLDHINKILNDLQIISIKKITCESIKFNDIGIEVWINTPWGNGQLNMNLLGVHNLSNLLASIAVCTSELLFTTILQRVSTLLPPKGRLQSLSINDIPHSSISSSNNGVFCLLPKIIIDYAHTPNGLENALLALKDHYATYKICCVFGCGGNRDIEKRPKMLEVAENYCNTIILTQDNSRHEAPDKIIKDILSHKIKNKSVKIYIEIDRREAIYNAINNFAKDHIILIAGKGHENKQIIGDKEEYFCDYSVATEVLKDLLKNNLYV